MRTTSALSAIGLALLASPALAAGYVCHYNPLDGDLNTILTADNLEKFELIGNELVVRDPFTAELFGKDKGERYTDRYRIIQNDSYGVVATVVASGENGIIAQTITIMKDARGKAIKMFTATADPRGNLILNGSCRAY
jgi:methionine-rich copper-binding protein CopC